MYTLSIKCGALKSNLVPAINKAGTHRADKAVTWWGSDNFLGALNSKGSDKVCNCRCEILYNICQVRLVNKFKDSSNSGISIAIQSSNSFRNESLVTISKGAEV